MKIKFSIYRFCPEFNKIPYTQEYVLDINNINNLTLLDALIKLKENDPTLTFRRSCREGVCGSDGMNINGVNGLACITSLACLVKPNKRKEMTIVIRPLPGLPVIRDLVVDMTQFYLQYERIKPFIINDDSTNSLSYENLQSPEDRSKLDGSYECILCACCSSFCPSFWWNPDKFIGPAGLLTLYRFLMDSRDTAKKERLEDIKDSFSVFRCHNIMNCVSVCPKKLNPAAAIGKIKRMLIRNVISK